MADMRRGGREKYNKKESEKKRDKWLEIFI